MVLAFIPFFALALLGALRLFPGKSWAEIFAASISLFLALLLVGTAAPGRWLGALILPFYISSLVCLLFCGVLALGVRRDLPLRKAGGLGEDWPWMLVVLLGTLLVGIVTFRYAIFDEVRLQGHLPVVEAMLRGHFPPAYIAFPDVDFRYHYGFNVLAALFSLALGGGASLGIDIATMLCWAGLVSGLLLLFSCLGVPRKAWALGFCFVILSGGMSWLLVAHHDGGSGPLYQLPNWQQMFIYLRAIHPSFILYFFQHPISLGLVFFLGMLRCFMTWSEEGNRKAYWAGIFLLGAMSLAQVMLFVTSLAALGAVFFWRFFSPGISKKDNFLSGIGVFLGAMTLALLLGGFFQWSAGAESQPLRFTWPPGYLRNEIYARGRPITGWQTLIWYFSGFGLALVLIPWAWWKACRAKPNFAVMFLLTLGILSAAIPHFFQYAYSWDIVKWFFAFEFSGRILVVAVFWPWVLLRKWHCMLAWALVFFGMVTPLRFLGELSFRSPASFTRAELRISGYRRPQWTGAFATLANRLNSSPENYGTVWSSASSSVGLAMATGFPMLQLDGNTIAMPVGRERIATRQAILKALQDQPSRELLQDQSVRWVIFSCAEASTPVLKGFLADLEKDASIENFSSSNGPRDCYQAYRLP